MTTRSTWRGPAPSPSASAGTFRSPALIRPCAAGDGCRGRASRAGPGRPRAPRGWRRTSRSGEPKWFRSARFRTGPTPRSSSSSEWVMAWSRRPRWWVIAKRCASSRTRWSSRSASESPGIGTGSERPGTKTSSIRLARPITATSSEPRSSSGASARMPAESWPLPPSITIRSGSEAKLSSRSESCGREVGLVLEAGDAASEDLLDRGEVVGPGRPVAADAEAAVVGLLRRAALEDDHRGHGVLAADVRDVEALDPHRQARQGQRVLQLGERVDDAADAVAPGAAGPGRGRGWRCARPGRAGGACRRARRPGPPRPRRAGPSAPAASTSARSRSASPTTISRGTDGAAE